MLCKDLISNLIPALNIKDTAERALQIMEEYHLSQLPLLEKNNYLGILTESELLDLDILNKSLEQLKIPIVQAGVLENAHAYEALKLVQDFNLLVVPVLDENRLYKGCIGQENLLQYLSNGTQYANEGGIIVLSTEVNNYSLSLIARLAESDNINILSVSNTLSSDGYLQITLKTNKLDLRSFIASLERFNYELLEVHGMDRESVSVQDNYDSFMKYINI